MQVHDKKKAATPGSRTLHRSSRPGTGIPNSALLSLLHKETPEQASMDPNALERIILSRHSGFRGSIQPQIPQAEAEADHLSAGVTGSSPDAVKEDMGRRLGADFSGVRFKADVF